MEDKKILSVENKEGKVVNMKENIFNDTDFSRFTSHSKLLLLIPPLPLKNLSHIKRCVLFYYNHQFQA